MAGLRKISIILLSVMVISLFGGCQNTSENNRTGNQVSEVSTATPAAQNTPTDETTPTADTTPTAEITPTTEDRNNFV